ncbi:MAG: exo-alpha-sialidase, partial [Chloroflexi bacterium]
GGTLAVAFPYIDLMSGPIPTRLLLTTSPDGGTTWTTPALIATIHDIMGPFPPERYRNLSLPAFACDLKTGQLYITWSDKGYGDADILFSTSKDRGQTWTTPIRVNDDPLRNGANQFQPQLVVAPDGVISISFFDTRVDPQHRLIDVFLAQSTNKGASFLKNVCVTTQSWDPAVDAPIDRSGQQFIGDYQGLAADNHFVHLFWNDTRTGKQEIFMAAVPSART